MISAIPLPAVGIRSVGGIDKNHSSRNIPELSSGVSRQTSMAGKEVVPESGLEARVVPVSGLNPQLQSRTNEQRNYQAIPEAGLEVVDHPSQGPEIDHIELERLQQEQLRIQVERQRLSRLQALDEEENRIKLRIEQVAGGSRQHI